MTYILAIDQGTTSSRAILFDTQMRPVQSCQQEFQQYFPHDGWVEHDAQEIWQSVLTAGRKLLQRDALIGRKCLGVGITNQRETTVLWDRKTGVPIHKAIVWQDRRTAETCQALARTQAASIVRSAIVWPRASMLIGRAARSSRIGGKPRSPSPP